MAHLSILPSNVTDATNVKFYDWDTGAYLTLSVSAVIASMKQINPSFNVFCFKQIPSWAGEYAYTGVRCWAADLASNAIHIADENYVTFQSYSYIAAVQTSYGVVSNIGGYIRKNNQWRGSFYYDQRRHYLRC